MAQHNKICKVCGELGHSKFYCKKKRNKLITKRGKYHEKWIQVRDNWYENNPSDYYNCTYCLKRISKSDSVLDHRLSRVRRPDLRFDIDNLTIACHNCNRLKGSRDEKEFTKEMQARRMR